ncbi:E3 ubiquitin-protein ligase RNF4-like [Python bivittatus]|uniref:E3 ubiquitin-protein ligase RNF4 n=1 Tax=Python bivittatus TaxID=176946 RepID=A0A9F5JCW0_PYTBI|nr:E3 ubiquitin-protein ligase RNF4-like [Python bivittatus]XP_025030567.1 E3 ubiquitin-protein ligase RNF4-like [Python bivittatus]XP_025030571.1 E3 ubiquitin-protein ligase RNF4-like [Python bivittatus]
MSPADTKRCGTKRRKNKKGSGLGPSNLAGVFEVKSVGPSSIIVPSCSSFSSSTPSTSTIAFLQPPTTNTASSSTENGLLAAAATATPLIPSEAVKKAEFQKKRCGGTINSRQTRKRNRISNSGPETASQEPIDLEVNTCEEVVDLTSETSEPIVVDLTHNDSVVIVEENVCQQQNQELRSQQLPDSCILSSDDDEPRDEVILTSTLPKELELLEEGISSSHRSGTVSCPICMDGYSEIIQNGRLIVSTKCGHVFCSQCLRDSLRNANSCPTCRKKLGYKQYHPIYI